MRAILRFLTLVALVATPSISFAQVAELRLGEQVVFTRDSGGVRQRIPQTTLDGFVYFSESAGAWGFCYGEKYYGSCTAGLFLDFTSWFEVAVAGGAERFRGDDGRNQTMGRYALSALFFGESICPLELYYENGASGEYWHQGSIMCEPARGLSFGIIEQRQVGIGPALKLRPIRAIPIEVWGARVYDPELPPQFRWNWTAGIRLVFQREK